MEKGKEKKKERGGGGEEGAERWEKLEDWLLPVTSTLPATHRDVYYLGPQNFSRLRSLLLAAAVNCSHGPTLEP